MMDIPVLGICAAGAGLGARFSNSERRVVRIRAQFEVDERLCSAHRCDQRSDTQDVHDPFEIIGQHMQGHLGTDPFQRFHLEVG